MSRPGRSSLRQLDHRLRDLGAGVSLCELEQHRFLRFQSEQGADAILIQLARESAH